MITLPKTFVSIEVFIVFFRWGLTAKSLKKLILEHRYEKTGFFEYAKTKTQISCSITAQLISAFVFATPIVQSLNSLNPKFHAYSHLKPGLCLTWLETPKTGFLRTRLIWCMTVVLAFNAYYLESILEG